MTNSKGDSINVENSIEEKKVFLLRRWRNTRKAKREASKKGEEENKKYARYGESFSSSHCLVNLVT